ncbi:uncharacterized protein LOC121878265 [Homarus americanus]|uniref:uncharacterized protein LOC121878265 n=1 Tax=Homarus americanus TaxID=6706 RepID=UPI001C467665|nr:uncharacterized protein LOC121878265 [Homarus americanus]
MQGILHVLAAWCLASVLAEPGKSVMGGLYWCSTLCMCRTETQVEVQCFNRNQVYGILDFSKRQVKRLEKNNFKIEEKMKWCNDLCLCHAHNDVEFKCGKEESLTSFIKDNIGDMFFYDTDEEPVVEEQQTVEQEQLVEEEEEIEETEPKRRSGKTKKRKNRKPKQIVDDVEEVEVVTTEAPLAEPEPEPTTHQVVIPNSTTALPITAPTITTTPSLPAHPIDHEDEAPVEEEAELLPKQEAVAASPAVTAMQPPTRRQPFPATVTAHTPHASTRESHTNAPKVSAVLEVPVERKTVASEVSQDLDELGNAVMQIKSDVVLNQRILLVTVAVAGIAMLGVLILAVHGCSRRRNSSSDTKKRDASKVDNHVTKVNLEQDW